MIKDFSSGSGKRIDYVFATSKLAKKVHNAWIDSKADGSDHQPYWVEFVEPLFDT